MSLKLKMLGLGVLAVMATSAFAAMNASATVSGHFTHDDPSPHIVIEGSEDGIHSAHSLQFERTVNNVVSGAAIVCDAATYTGTVNANTLDTIQVTPSYDLCQTTGGSPDEVEVTTNGCSYTFRSNSNASTHTPTEKATVTVDCPAGAAIEIHHPNCTNTVGPQALRGVTYTTITTNTKHALTVNITVLNIQGTFHGGICIFLGTNQTFDMTGSVTVAGLNTATGNPVNITAT